MIERTQSGRYKVRWRDAEGKNQSKTFDLKRDASEHEAAVTLAKRQGHLTVEPRWRRTLRAQIGAAEIAHDTINPHGFFVYLLWPVSDDMPLYVGMSMRVLGRLGQHMADPAKAARIARITLIKCETAAEMAALEIKLIRFYNPELNVRDNGKCAACGAVTAGLNLYCCDECRKGTQTVNRKTRVVPASLTLTEIGAAHRRAAQKLRLPRSVGVPVYYPPG